MSQELDRLCIDTIRFLSVDAVQKANSGHPGMPLDAAPMAYVLWTRLLKHNPRNPRWFDRDRFASGSSGRYSNLSGSQRSTTVPAKSTEAGSTPAMLA